MMNLILKKLPDFGKARVVFDKFWRLKSGRDDSQDQVALRLQSMSNTMEFRLPQRGHIKG